VIISHTHPLMCVSSLEAALAAIIINEEHAGSTNTQMVSHRLRFDVVRARPCGIPAFKSAGIEAQ